MGIDFNPDQDVPDLTGRVFFITGGTNGLGAATALHLAKHNASKIFISGRSAPNADKVIKEAKSINPSTNVIFIKCDLTSLSAVKAAATEFRSRESRLDVLICNAGIMATAPGLTSDGYEVQFGTNHLGHAMLIRHFLPLLQKQPTSAAAAEEEVEGKDDTVAEGRIVILTSQGYMLHPRKGILFEELKTTQDHGMMWSWRRYGQSKLANILYARELAKRYPSIKSVCVHPGVVATGLVDTLSWGKRAFVYVTNFGRLLQQEEGAWNQVWAATTREKDRLVNGEFFLPVGKVTKVDTTARDDKLAGQLWEWTEKALDQF